MNTLEYLQAVKASLNITSDYALAKALGITQSTISGYRVGRSRIDDDVALRIAEILGKNPLEVIAAANAERSKSPEMRMKWMGIMEKFSMGFKDLMSRATPRRRRLATR